MRLRRAICIGEFQTDHSCRTEPEGKLFPSKFPGDGLLKEQEVLQ
jgi:hypothetical protein